MAENFARKYDNLMEDFQEYMENKTKELDSLNKQFGWVSKLANYTKSPDGFFKIKAVSLYIDTWQGFIMWMWLYARN